MPRIARDRMPRGGTSGFYEDLWRRKSKEESTSRQGREQNAIPHIPTGGRLLDVGCGSGALLRGSPTRPLAVGADISRSALVLAHERGLWVVRATFEGPHLPFRGQTFDCVTCLDVIEHLFDPRPLLRELRRVLRPNGILILQTPNVRHYLQLYRIAVKGHGPQTSGDPEGVDGGHVHYFTAKDVAILIREAGFDRPHLHGTEGVRFFPSFRSLGILAIARRTP